MIKFIETLTEDMNNSIFDIETKKMFLAESMKENVLSENSIRNYTRVFIITSKHEKRLAKDVSNFTLEELEVVLYGFDSNNLNTIESYARILSSYINWCVDKKITSENPLSKITSKEFRKYLTDAESYFTENELRRYEDSCINYQDAVIFRMLFNGFGGKKFSEISNLRKQDVFWDRKEVSLRNVLSYDENGIADKYTERIISVDDRTLDLIRGAINSEIYYKSNGEMDYLRNVKPYTELMKNEDSDYVIRPSLTRADMANKPVGEHVIYRRIKIISESLGIGKLTAKYVQRSGMVYLANELVGDSDTLTLNDIKIIGNRFNMVSYHNIKGYVTMEAIEKTYPREREETIK